MILIADDNDDVRRMIRSLIDEIDPDVIEAIDGGSAIEAFEVNRPEWVLMDINMHPIDGLTAMRTILERHPDARIEWLGRISDEEPFKDVIACYPTRGREKDIAPHPSLKPQRFMRQVVRASLPLGIGIVYDPFAGSGSTLAAAEAVGYRSIGTERDAGYVLLWFGREMW